MFYGIMIRMFFNDHAPPHFHAIYGQDEAQVSIETGELIGGRLPSRARRLVREWALRLMANWERARPGVREPLERIPGLDWNEH